jgi:hypothetical protein
MWVDGWRLYLSVVKTIGFGCSRIQGTATLN